MQQRLQRRTHTNLTRADRMGYAAGGIGLIAWALGRRGAAGLGAAGLGGWLLYQAYTGSNPMFEPLGIRVNRHPAEAGAAETIVLDEVITVGRPRDELYRFWRDLQALPRIAPRLREVTVTDSRRSHWRIDGPRGTPVEWQSEITHDEPGQEIAWRTTRDEVLTHFGTVRFRPAAGDRGTVVEVHLEYVPPAGALGTAVARLAGQSPQRLVREALRRMKQLLETGEIATTRGQPAGGGRSPLAAHLERSQARDAGAAQ
jgi:uncharacterized membrane protein